MNTTQFTTQCTRRLRAAAVFPVCCLFALSAPFAGAATAYAGASDEDANVRIKLNETGSGNTIRITLRENDEEVRVMQHDGVTRVQLNGEDVPPERIREARDRIVILDKDGNELRSLRLNLNGGLVFDHDGKQPGSERARGRAPGSGAPQAGPRTGRPPGGGTPPTGPDAHRTPGGGAPPHGGPYWGRTPGGGSSLHAGPPRGQIGISMGRVDPALASHLGINPDEVILIASVRDGAPADRAGLHRHDIIIKVDGEAPVTPQRLHRLVREKQPGDTATFTILRAGERKQIEVEVAPVEARRDRETRREFKLMEELGQRLSELADRLSDEELREEFIEVERLSELIRELLREENFDALRRRFAVEFRESLEQAGQLDEEMREKLRALTERGGERAREALERLGYERDLPRRVIERLEMETWPQRIELERMPGGIEFFRDEEGKLQGIFTQPPDTPRPPRHGAGLERLEQRLEQMERRLERMEELLARLVEDS